LLHNSIDSWEQLELKLSDLTSIRERDMADLAFNGLCSYLREKLDDHTFITLSQLQQNASAQESRSKENKDNFKHTRRNVNYVDCDFDRSSDKSNDVYAAEFCWPSKAKPYACDSLKPVHKNRQKEIKLQVDKNPFSVSTIDLQNSKVPIRPE
jgi:hypothetical protein